MAKIFMAALRILTKNKHQVVLKVAHFGLPQCQAPDKEMMKISATIFLDCNLPGNLGSAVTVLQAEVVDEQVG